jgi:hypothetical protein
MKSLGRFVVLTPCLVSEQSSSAAPQLAAAGALPLDELTRQTARDLASNDPATLAWAACRAGDYQVPGAVPLLQRLLESPPAMTARERSALLDVVLDALIQLQARLPASAIARFTEERPVHQLVLLANAIDRESTLLEAFSGASGLRWYAIANMLLQDRSPGLARRLVTTLRLHVIITVADGDETATSGGSSSAGVGDGIGENPVGYPPHAQYRLELGARTGFLVLGTGPRIVYYSRTVSRRFQFGESETVIDGPGDEDRLSYLRAMLGPATDSGLRGDTVLSIRWSTPDALIQRIEGVRADVRRRYYVLIDALVRSSYLTSDVAATLSPTIDLQLVDRRKDQSVALLLVPR